jgi:hypothetical protein
LPNHHQLSLPKHGVTGNNIAHLLAEISEDAPATVGDDLVVGGPLIGTSRSKSLRDLRDRRLAAVDGSRVGWWLRGSIQAVSAAAEQELHAWVLPDMARSGWQ